MARGRWINGSWSGLRHDRIEHDERMYIHEVEDLLDRGRRTILRWGLAPVGKDGRFNLYSRRQAIQLALDRGVAIDDKRKPSRIALRESHAVSLFRQGLSVDQVSAKAGLPTSYSAEIYAWWLMAAQLVTYRKETVDHVNRMLTCASTQVPPMHLGLHVPHERGGLYPLLGWMMDLMHSEPQVTREREALEARVGQPLFSDPSELDAWIDSVQQEELEPSSPSSPSVVAHAYAAGDSRRSISTLLSAEEAATMLGVSTREVRRISQKANTPLPKREIPGNKRNVFYLRSDVIAHLYERASTGSTSAIESMAAEAAVLFNAGTAVDEVLVELRLGCDHALQLYADWAEFHVACVEGHVLGAVMKAFRRRRLAPPRELLDSSPAVREAALLSLVRASVRRDQMQAELNFQKSRHGKSDKR